MDSVPPATTISEVPSIMFWAPRIMALREEAQTLFTVVAMTVWGRPAPRAH
jgi:hypothetical protein